MESRIYTLNGNNVQLFDISLNEIILKHKYGVHFKHGVSIMESRIYTLNGNNVQLFNISLNEIIFTIRINLKKIVETLDKKIKKKTKKEFSIIERSGEFEFY
jgi:hypothetical protein